MFSGHSRLVRDEIAERGANDADEGAVVVVAGWMDEWGIGCMVGWPGEESKGLHNIGTEQIEWLVGKVSYNLRYFCS